MHGGLSLKKFNMGCIIKVLALAVLVVIGIFVYVTCSGNTGCGCQRIDKTLPAISAAPYSVTTKTNNYYAEKTLAGENGSVALYGWYEKLDNRWVRHAGPDIIPALLKPIVKRR